MTDTREESIMRFKLLCETLRFASDKGLQMAVKADDAKIAFDVLAILSTEAAPSEPVAWQWRLNPNGFWNQIHVPIPDFKRLQERELKSGEIEIRPLYAHPPAQPDTTKSGSEG